MYLQSKYFLVTTILSKTWTFKYSRCCRSGPLPYCTGRHQLTTADKIKTNLVYLLLSMSEELILLFDYLLFTRPINGLFI